MKQNLSQDVWQKHPQNTPAGRRIPSLGSWKWVQIKSHNEHWVDWFKLTSPPYLIYYLNSYWIFLSSVQIPCWLTMMADYAIQIYPNLSMTLGTSVIHELRISFGKQKVHGMMPNSWVNAGMYDAANLSSKALNPLYWRRKQISTHSNMVKVVVQSFFTTVCLAKSCSNMLQYDWIL